MPNGRLYSNLLNFFCLKSQNKENQLIIREDQEKTLKMNEMNECFLAYNCI